MTPARARLVREGLTLLGYPVPPGDTWDAKGVAALAAYGAATGQGRMFAENGCANAAFDARQRAIRERLAQERANTERAAEERERTPPPERVQRVRESSELPDWTTSR